MFIPTGRPPFACETCGFAACPDHEACWRGARFDIEAGIKARRKEPQPRGLDLEPGQAFLCAVAADLLEKWSLEDVC